MYYLQHWNEIINFLTKPAIRLPQRNGVQSAAGHTEKIKYDYRDGNVISGNNNSIQCRIRLVALRF